MWVFCVAVTVVVNIQGHKFARFSVLYNERCWKWWLLLWLLLWLLWMWSASVSNRGAQSPTVTIIIVDKLRWWWLCRLPLCGGGRRRVANEAYATSNSLGLQLGRRCRGNCEALFDQVWYEVLGG